MTKIIATTLSEAQVTTIHKKITQGFLEGDLSFIDKYLYPGTKIIVDLDPSPSAGEKEVSMREYRGILEMGIQMEDVSISTTVYGVVNNQIKVLEARDTIISTGPVE